MKKLFPALFLLVFLSQKAFPADEVLQKIGMEIDKKSPGYKIELILEKVILSVAVSNSKVRIYSAEKADLDYSGISELNGKVLMKVVKKGGYYQIQLYQADKEKETLLFDDTIKLYLKNFGDTVYDIAQDVIGSIAKKYPAKPVRELTTINLVKVKLSEYESENGYWTIGGVFSYNILDVNVGIRESSNSDYAMEKKFQNKGGSVNLEGVYRFQQWTFILGAAASRGGWNEGSFHSSFSDINLNAAFGYGFFGSLFVIGIDTSLYFCNFVTDYTNYYMPLSRTLVAPDVNFRSWQLNMFLQINITKDYYLTFTSGPPIPLALFNQYNLDFNKGKYSEFSNVTMPAAWMFGMPQIKLSLNFRLFPNWWMRVYYELFGPNFNKNDNNTEHILILDTTSTLKLDSFNYNKTRIGLGAFYAF